MNRHSQRGSIAWVICAIGVAIFLSCLFYESTPAAPDDVSALAAATKADPAATAILQEGLKQSPTPTRKQLAELRGRVNEQLVLNASRTITGDAGLRSSAELEAEASRKSMAEADASFAKIVDEDPWVPYALVAAALCAVGVFGISVFKASGRS